MMHFCRSHKWPLGAIRVPNAACIRACRGYMVCPHTSCTDCCIGHSNSACAGPDVVGGSCSSKLLLHPAPTCPDAGPDLCTLRW